MTRLSTQRPPTGSGKQPSPRRARRAQRRRPSAVARVLTAAGVLLLAVGIGCLGYVGYQLFGTNVTAHRAQDQEREQLREQWQQDSGDAATGSGGGQQKSGGKQQKSGGAAGQDALQTGDAMALLSIPAIGVDEIPVLEGTTDKVLSRGIGHYSETAAAGAVGNFAVAGHRITHGEPFADLLQLQTGDTVVVETRDAIFTYAVEEAPQKLTVQDTETWVLDPVPGKPDAEPKRELITLTTCQDLFRSPDRSVGFGKLVETEQK